MTNYAMPPEVAQPLIRVSKDAGRSEAGTLRSPDMQMTSIGELCRSRGIQLRPAVSVLDESASIASSPWWPRLQAALEDIRAGTYKYIVVDRLDRIFRNTLRFHIFWDDIQRAGGVLLSVKEGFDSSDTSDPNQLVMRSIVAAIAEAEAIQRGRNWRAIQVRRKKAGLPGDGRPRWGYTKVGLGDSTEYVPDTDLRDVIEMLYQRYACGEGHAALAKTLDDLGIRGAHGAKWNASTLAGWMDRGFAAGYLATGGYSRDGRSIPLELIDGAQSPVIDEKAWAAYQSRRAQQRPVPTRARAARCAWTAIARCGAIGPDGKECGSRMVSASGHHARGLGPHYMLRCAAYQERRGCTGSWIKVDTVARRVLRTLEALPRDDKAAAAVLKRGRVRPSPLGPSLADADASVTRLEQKLELLVGRWAEAVDPDTRRAVRRNEDKVRLALQEARTVAQLLRSSASPEPAVPQRLGRLGDDWETLDEHTRGRLLTSLIDHVTIRPRFIPDDLRIEIWPHGWSRSLPARSGE